MNTSLKLIVITVATIAFAATAQAQGFTATVSPQPIVVTRGVGFTDATVFTSNVQPSIVNIRYLFGNLPTGVTTTPPDQLTDAPGFPPVTFTFRAAADTLPGTYTIGLAGVPRCAATCPPGLVGTQAFPVTLIVQQSDISATFAENPMSICGNSLPIDNSVTLQAVNGYSGAPTLFFESIPSGMTVNPTFPTANPFGPGSTTIPFTVQTRNMNPGVYTIFLHIIDRAAGIDKRVPLQINIPAADYTPIVSPRTLALTAGGNPDAVSVSVIPDACFFANVSVTATAPPEISVTPGSVVLSAPYSPQSFSLQAVPGAAAGAYTVMFTFVTAGDAPKTVPVTVTVVAGPAPTRDFTIDAQPPTLSMFPGESRQITVSATGINGFTGPITVVASAPSGATVTPSSFQITPGGSQTVTLTLPPGTPAGSLQVLFSGTSPGVAGPRLAQVTVQVNAVVIADFSLSAVPATQTIAPGASAPVNVSLQFTAGSTYPVQVTASAPAGITVTPATFSFSANGTQTVSVAVAANAPSGPQTIVFTGVGSGRTRTAQVVINVPQRDFTLTVTPSAVSIAAGESVPVTVAATGISAITGPINVTVSAAAGLTVTPSTFTIAAGAPATVVVTSVNAPVGTQSLVFTAQAAGITRTATLAVTTLPRNPVIRSISPPALSTASASAVVVLTGTGFAPGAVVSSTRPGLLIQSTQVIDSTLANVVVRVSEDATPGRYPIIIRNPDGGTSAANVALLVYPSTSMSAPLGVTTAAIVFPVSGAFVAQDEAVYARGLLATTGTGAIFGEWQLDGIPFDVFTATVSGGMPTEVRSHVAIPTLVSGGHRLELVVRSPQYAVSPAITVVQTIDTASRLTLLWPRDGSVVGTGDTFRWSLVPGASGYEVEVDHSESVLPRLVRVTDAEWTVGSFDLNRLGSGVRRWRVRPVLPGEVRGEPTRWNRFVVLPERVVLSVSAPQLDSATGRHVVRWSGGYPGLLYRIEFVDPNGNVVFRALTIHQEYALPRGAADRLQRLSVRVVPVAPNGAIVGESNASPMPSTRGRTKSPYVYARAEDVASIMRQEPANNATIAVAQPVISAQWSTAVDPDAVALVIDNVDVTAVSDITPVSVRHQTLLPLGAGPHRVSLTAGALTSAWQFTVVDVVSAAQPAPETTDAPPTTADGKPADAAAAEKAKTSSIRTDWTVMPIGTIAATSGPGTNEVRAQVSGQGDVTNTSATSNAKFTGDAGLTKQLEDPKQTLSKNRNWLTDFGAKQSWGGEQVVVGYNIPSIFDQAQLLTLGLARGGALGTLKTRIGAFSYYKAFDSNAGGAATSYFNPRQDVRGFAYETPFDRNRWLVRLAGLDVDEGAGPFTLGGKGKSLGIFTKFAIGKATNLVVEAARGEFKPGFNSLEQSREGNAVSLRLEGNFGRYSYRANLRNTDASFVNPANRGLTPASVADRRGGDFSLTRMFGTSIVIADLRYLTGASSSGVSGPGTRESGGKLSLSNFSLGRRLTLGGSVNMTNTRAGALEIYGLPASDRTLRGGELTLATSGRIQLSQSFSIQKTSDNNDALNDMTMTNLTVAANGTLFRNATLSALASGIRSKPGNPFSGQTDTLVVSVNPSFAIPVASIALRPSLTYTRTENSAYSAFSSETKSYGAGIQWDPMWFSKLLSLQFTSTWLDTKAGALRTKPDPTYSATITLRKPIGRGPAVPTGATLPGATPIAVPEAATSNPIQGSTPASTNPN